MEKERKESILKSDKNSVSVCLCLCVCVCLSLRQREREKERKRKNKERERERHKSRVDTVREAKTERVFRIQEIKDSGLMVRKDA